MKKRILALVAASVLVVGLLAGCSDGKSGGELNIFTWDGYVPQSVVDKFTEKTGIKVNFSNFDTNEEMLTKLQATKGGEYDIVIASDYIIDIARGEGLVKELDKNIIKNYDNIASGYRKQYYDPEDKYTVPYAVGTPLIVYDPAKVSVDIKGFADLWDPALAESIVAMDDARNIIGITLKSMGYGFNETDPAVLAAAKEKLFKLKPNIRALSYDNTQSMLITGEASVGYLFTSQVVELMNARPDYKIVYPEEGLGFGIDAAFVPKNAPNSENAMKFLNFMLEPEIGAEIAQFTLYVCPNEKAMEHIPEDTKLRDYLYIPAEKLEGSEFIKDVGEAADTYYKIWTEFGLLD